ncbi:MAG: FAD-dependent oxidoreductase [Sphingomonadales bacterium]|nr:FAD-dependent oxidoreductase [Sphingomonadales bacterium]MDE2168155.1 FAD-dependent oxidoreductase [Sphingomonadales bacterium]
MAGLACASRLRDSGCTVSVIDKGRGAGGRMATRRLETACGMAQADLGAPFFSAHDPGFAQMVEHWARQDLVAPWPEAGTGQWTAIPAMNAILKHLAAPLDVRFGCMVKALARDERRWWVLTDAGRLGPFDAVILAIPAEQAAPLLSLHDFDQARAALSVPMLPCWTAIYVFDQRLPVASSHLEGGGVIERAIRNSGKPGRTGPETWVVQAGAGWSADHLEWMAADVGDHLLQALSAMVGQPLPQPISRSVHRWRYARPAQGGRLMLWNDNLRIGACGDWLEGTTVEAAWLSGMAAAGHVTKTACADRAW